MVVSKNKLLIELINNQRQDVELRIRQFARDAVPGFLAFLEICRAFHKQK